MPLRRTIMLTILTTALACTSSTPTGTPGVTQEGKNRVWYQGSDLAVEIYYASLPNSLGDQYAVPRISFYGPAGTTEISRTNIRLTTPDGSVVVPLDQTEFRKVYGGLRMAIEREGAWYGPSARFTASRQPCDRWFIYPPTASDDGFTGQRHGFDTIFVSSFQVCGGPLVFPVLKGIQPGRWVLTVELEETTARVPFEVELPVNR